MRMPLFRALALVGSVAALPALASRPPMANASQPAQWISLFDGQSTTGWRGYRQREMPDGWKAVDGALTRVGEGGTIVTEREFDDFELELEWKVAPAGNSGIFYRATEETPRIFENATELQVLDNVRHPDNKTPLTLAGANYGLYPAPADAAKPVGEWNHVRIIARGAHVEHWLNGRKVVDYELWSPDWEARVKASKFAQWPPYGRARRGRIGLQDHGDWVAYRNIRIRELK